MSIDQSVLDKFEAVVESQRKRIMDMKAQDDFIDYSKLDNHRRVRRRRHRPDDHRHGSACAGGSAGGQGKGR
mgnify:CR=1 FL=1